jgi:hypothetical protein
MADKLKLFSPLAQDSRVRNENALSDFMAIYATNEHDDSDCYDMLVNSSFGYKLYLQGLVSEYEGNVNGLDRLATEYKKHKPTKETKWHSFSIQMFTLYCRLCLGFTDAKFVVKALNKLSDIGELEMDKFTSLVIKITKDEIKSSS